MLSSQRFCEAKLVLMMKTNVKKDEDELAFSFVLR